MRIGELFSGYGGLGLGVQAAIGGTVVWHSDIDPGACKILAHRYPDVPNLGDVTAVDWSQVEPVDVLTGGTPCQDLSHAGKRGGMTEGTRSNLWVAMREAIAALRPSVVVWENVRGALSAAADSEVESREGLLGVGRPGPYLRAAGRVVGDLSALGYVGGLHTLRAADVGAPHGRARVFLVAEDAQRLRRRPGRLTAPGETASGWSSTIAGRSGGVAEPGPALLPTPAVNDMGEGKTPAAWDEWTAKMQAAHGNGNGHGKSLAIEAQRLLPTPTSMDERASGGGYNGQTNVTLTDATVRQTDRWGDYAAAIARWEHVLGRPAPPPTQPSRKGTPQLSPRFSEFLMGLPAGWVTDVPGITRNEALRALGNGVVPQQATAALRFLLSVQEVLA